MKVPQKSYLKKEVARQLLLKPNSEMPIRNVVLYTQSLEAIRPLANDERLAKWATRFYLSGQHKRI